jgi:hypothetical protein
VKKNEFFALQKAEMPHKKLKFIQCVSKEHVVYKSCVSDMSARTNKKNTISARAHTDTHRHTYTHTDTYTHTLTNKDTKSTHTLSVSCTDVYTLSLFHARTHARTHAHTQTYTHMSYTHTLSVPHAHTHAHTHARARRVTHASTRLFKLSSEAMTTYYFHSCTCVRAPVRHAPVSQKRLKIFE